jgi:hypothetical protein
MTLDVRAEPSSAWSLSATPRTIVIDLLAGAIVKLVAEGRAPASRDLAGRNAEAIP